MAKLCLLLFAFLRGQVVRVGHPFEVGICFYDSLWLNRVLIEDRF